MIPDCRQMYAVAGVGLRKTRKRIAAHERTDTHEKDGINPAGACIFIFRMSMRREGVWSM